MKILFIASRFDGGIGRHAARVAKELGQHEFDIKLMRTSHIPIKKNKKSKFCHF